ncbi:MAG: tRNA (adenosine(37)-N6)-threonylcarbamoyltransferase complex ATPase subunit type 1 TsaE [Candidatus Cloacimonetes bacterium]|nr:tRNA (adenosine(37)-N6)-threonylcarbamoyltransferase complex ATPase subunit type 1 TsaE [Candidatus Cloacimonadota bacterium]MBL7086798.1 tRNA (adenosine(37)-N6)-threonylcarbamoyltransferase complex ATPase subunit type 1 TsaE [Candidatus Cloacimonadota bacterium]
MDIGDEKDEITKISHSLKETGEIAKEFSNKLSQGDVVALYGPLGSGKTFFVRETAKCLGAGDLITSPSFVILNEYKTNLPIYHFDFYRLKNEEEIANIGFTDFLNQKGIFFIEWPEKAEQMLPEEYYRIVFEILDKNSRKIIISKIHKMIKHYLY